MPRGVHPFYFNLAPFPLSFMSRFPQPGEDIGGRYRILSEVGSGGFARIYHAVQTDLERDVALKLLEPTPFEHLSGQKKREFHGQLVQRFQREARNVSQLRDPHTVTLYDHGRTSEGLLYMVFEYIDGRDLKFAARQGVRLEAERVVNILRQILESLHEAHALGLLHRDIKPGNIMLYEHVGRRDRVKVLDFGISKALLEGANMTVQDLTSEGLMLGTPRYMSPEQLKGADIGPPSDLYSLGLVTYELLVGRKAIDDDATHEIINRQINPDPIALPVEARVPEGLRRVTDRLLAKRPGERFQSARETLEALDAWETGGPAGPSLRETSTPAADSQPMAASPTDDSAASNEIAARGAPDASDASTSNTSKADAWAGAAAPDQIADEEAINWTPVALSAAGILVAGLAGFSLFAVFQSGNQSASQPPQGRIAGSDGPTPAVDRPATAPPPSVGNAAASADDAPVDTIHLRSKPESARIWLNGQYFGTTPVKLSPGAVAFPADLEAKLPDGRRIERALDSRSPEIVLEFESAPTPGSDGSDGTDQDQEPTRADDPAPPPSPDAPPSTGSPSPAPADEGSDDDEESDFPALDL